MDTRAVLLPGRMSAVAGVVDTGVHAPSFFSSVRGFRCASVALTLVFPGSSLARGVAQRQSRMVRPRAAALKSGHSGAGRTSCFFRHAVSGRSGSAPDSRRRSSARFAIVSLPARLIWVQETRRYEEHPRARRPEDLDSSVFERADVVYWRLAEAVPRRRQQRRRAARRWKASRLLVRYAAPRDAYRQGWRTACGDDTLGGGKPAGEPPGADGTPACGGPGGVTACFRVVVGAGGRGRVAIPSRRKAAWAGAAGLAAPPIVLV